MSTKSEDLINFIACSKIIACNNVIKVVRDMVPGGYVLEPLVLFTQNVMM